MYSSCVHLCGLISATAGYTSRRLRRFGQLRAQLLRESYHCARLFRRFCADGSVRARQRRRRCAHETPRGQPTHVALVT